MLEYNRLIANKMTKPMRLATLLLPVICIVLLLSQTVFAKNTYLINDSGRVVIHTTYTTNPEDVLYEVGLQLGADDTFTTEPGLGISEITVQRKQAVTITHGGNIFEVVSYGETVESLLERLSLSVTKEDVVSVPLSSQTFDGLQITISRSLEMEETYVTAQPYGITYCYDASLSEGEEKLISPGVDGQVMRTAKVKYTDGKEVSRTIISETVVVQPINAVVAVSTYIEQPSTEEEIPEVDVGPSPVTRPEVTGQPIIGDGYIITPDGERLTYTHVEQFKATAYNNQDPGCGYRNAIGTPCRVGAIAVDPKVIPYGTRMYIVSNDGKYIYGIATAEDCGGAIKGKRIDLYFDTVWECNVFGIRNCQVYFLG